MLRVCHSGGLWKASVGRMIPRTILLPISVAIVWLGATSHAFTVLSSMARLNPLPATTLTASASNVNDDDNEDIYVMVNGMPGQGRINKLRFLSQKLVLVF